MSAGVVALRCRTSDRTAGGARGAETLAAMLGEQLGAEARLIGTAGQPRSARYDEDLRDSRGCLLEAGGQVDDALAEGRVPVLLAGDCSVCLTTLGVALRWRPDARILWLDSHGDFNTPETTPSGYLGGMCLAGACREWDPGLGEPVDPARLILAGVRELDAGERALLERSDATVIGASVIETLVAVKNALGAAPVYLHVDLDVLDGLSADKLFDLLESVAEEREIVGIEITGVEGEPAAAMAVLRPVVDALAREVHVHD